MKLTIIVAAIIIAVAILLNNGIYVPLERGLYLNKFTGECFTVLGRKLTEPERKKKSAEEFLRERADEDPLDLIKGEQKGKKP